jgi:hypothetical protein
MTKWCRRKPCGRFCRLVRIEPGRVFVHDIGFWSGWVSKKTFETKWETF